MDTLLIRLILPTLECFTVCAVAAMWSVERYCLYQNGLERKIFIFHLMSGALWIGQFFVVNI